MLDVDVPDGGGGSVVEGTIASNTARATKPKQATKEQVKKLVAEIKMGRWDAHIELINDQFRMRLIDQKASIRWLIRTPSEWIGQDWCGQSVILMTEDDLTMGELVAVERRTGKPWGAIHPALSGQNIIELMRVRMLSLGVAPADADAMLAALGVTRTVDLIGEYGAAGDPKAAVSEPE